MFSMTFTADAQVIYLCQSLQKWTQTGSINPYPPVRKLTDPFHGEAVALHFPYWSMVVWVAFIYRASARLPMRLGGGFTLAARSFSMA